MIGGIIVAMIFKPQPTGTLKAQSATSDATYNIKGINSSLSSATEAVTEINKFLDIYGVEIADDNTSLTIVKEGEDE